MENQRELLGMKIQMEKENKDFLGDLNSFAFVQGNSAADEEIKTNTNKDQKEKTIVASSLNPKYDFYQNNTHVFVSFRVLGNNKEFAKNTKVDIQKQ